MLGSAPKAPGRGGPDPPEHRQCGAMMAGMASSGSNSRAGEREAAPGVASLILPALLVLAGGAALFGPAQAAYSRTSPLNSALGSRLSPVVRPMPLVAATGRRFGSPKAALAYCQQGECSTPAQLEALYDMTPLFAKGDDGKGVTIAVVDSFGSPTIARDLAYFDKAMRIPNPPRLTVIHPAGQGATVQPGHHGTRWMGDRDHP